MWHVADIATRMQISPQEMNAIAFAFNNAQSAQENGIRVGGTKYVFNKIEDLGNVPVLHCAKVTIYHSSQPSLYAIHQPRS